MPGTVSGAPDWDQLILVILLFLARLFELLRARLQSRLG